jgi:ABC-2 type transport system ATP-binding protein
MKGPERPGAGTDGDPTPIVVDGLHVTLEGREILRGVSFTVERGDVFGFVGPNGAGKTTTIRAILGLYHPAAGRVTVMGFDAGSDRARACTGFALDQDGLYDGMTAAENIAFYLRLYDRPDDPGRIDQVMRLVGLADRADDLVATFSSGMRKRTALARAVAHHPAVVVLDEPTSGVDPTAQSEIRDLLLEIARQENAAVLLSSHNLQEVQQLCNRVAIIAAGQIQLTGDLAELRERMGDHTVTVLASDPVPEPAVAILRAATDLGLRHVQGTRLTFAPAAGVRTTTVVAGLAAAGVEVDRLTTNDASLEDLFASVVAHASSDPTAQDADPAPAHRRGRLHRGRERKTPVPP